MRAIAGDELRTRLRAMLRELVDRDLDFALPPMRLSGGAFSTNYVFELAQVPVEWSGRLVLRLLASGAQVRIEAGLQTGAQAAGVPAPGVLHVEATDDALGAPFMVMEFLPGRGFLGGIEWYRFARDFPKMLRSWPAVLADTIGLLGRVESGPVLDALSRLGVTEAQALTTRHLSWIKDNIGDSSALAAAAAWLQANEPSMPQRLRLVHGDLWPANVLMERATVAGLVDWTMGAVGDPAMDVGFAKVGLALMPEPFPPPPPIRGAVRACGVRMATRVHELCAPAVGGDQRVGYYEALRCIRQITQVDVDRRIRRANGWQHGVPALMKYFNTITGLNIDPP